MLTTSQAQEDILRSYQLYAGAYVTKPIDYDDVIRAIGHIDGFYLRLASCPAYSPASGPASWAGTRRGERQGGSDDAGRTALFLAACRKLARGCPGSLP